MRPKDRKQLKQLLAQPRRPVPEIVLSPSLGAPIARPPAALMPVPVLRFDAWSDLVESVYSVRLVIGRQLSEERVRKVNR